MFARTIRIGALSFGLAVAVAAPAAASHANNGHGHHGPAAGHGNGHGKGHDKSKFTAVGTVESVDGNTVTVNDKGGTKSLHRTTVTITVPDSAKVIVDDADASTSDVAAGDHIVVKGTNSADSYTATRVVASTPDSDSSTSDDPSSDDQGGTDTAE